MPTAAEKAAARQALRQAATEPPPADTEQAKPAGDPNAVRRALTPTTSPKAKMYPRRITLDLTEAQDDRLAGLAMELRPVAKAEILRTLLDTATDEQIKSMFAGRTWAPIGER